MKEYIHKKKTISIKNILLSLLIFIPLLASCSSNQSQRDKFSCQTIESPCLQGKAIVELTTNKGIITLEIDGDASPLTAGNYADLIEKGIYEDTIFHRVIKAPEPFVIQGGDPISKDISTPKTQYGTGSYIDPSTGQARLIPLEIKLQTEESPRYNQLITNPSELTELQLSHQRGSLAMARSESLGSASAQFYIGLKNLPELDGRYSVFGRVIKGVNVLDKIEQGDVILETRLVSPNK